MVWNLFPFKGDFSWKKARSHRAPNVGCREAESPGWFDVSQKNSILHESDAWEGTLSWWSCQSPVAHSCGCFWLNYISQPMKNSEVVFLISLEDHLCDGQHLPSQITQLTWFWSCCNFDTFSLGVENKATPVGMTGPLLLSHSHRPTIHHWLWPSWGIQVHW